MGMKHLNYSKNSFKNFGKLLFFYDCLFKLVTVPLFIFSLFLRLFFFTFNLMTLLTVQMTKLNFVLRKSDKLYSSSDSN